MFGYVRRIQYAGPITRDSVTVGVSITPLCYNYLKETPKPTPILKAPMLLPELSPKPRIHKPMHTCEALNLETSSFKLWGCESGFCLFFGGTGGRLGSRVWGLGFGV